MKNTYSFKIASPCSQNRDEMLPQSEGRYCFHCQKTVVDFTKMSDMEIAAFIHTHKGEKVCGTIYPHQQAKKYHFVQANPIESPVKRYIMAVLTGLMTTLPYNISANNNNLQSIEHFQEANQTVKTIPPTSKNSISGQLINKETGKPLAFVVVTFNFFSDALHFYAEKMDILTEEINAIKEISPENIKRKKALSEEKKALTANIIELKSKRSVNILQTETDENGYFMFELPDYVTEMEVNLSVSFKDIKIKDAKGQEDECWVKGISAFSFYYKGGNQHETGKLSVTKKNVCDYPEEQMLDGDMSFEEY